GRLGPLFQYALEELGTLGLTLGDPGLALRTASGARRTFAGRVVGALAVGRAALSEALLTLAGAFGGLVLCRLRIAGSPAVRRTLLRFTLSVGVALFARLGGDQRVVPALFGPAIVTGARRLRIIARLFSRLGGHVGPLRLAFTTTTLLTLTLRGRVRRSLTCLVLTRLVPAAGLGGPLAQRVEEARQRRAVTGTLGRFGRVAPGIVVFIGRAALVAFRLFGAAGRLVLGRPQVGLRGALFPLVDGHDRRTGRRGGAAVGAGATGRSGEIEAAQQQERERHRQSRQPPGGWRAGPDIGDGVPGAVDDRCLEAVGVGVSQGLEHARSAVVEQVEGRLVAHAGT